VNSFFSTLQYLSLYRFIQSKLKQFGEIEYPKIRKKLIRRVET
jgi:hypothetical protein